MLEFHRCNSIFFPVHVCRVMWCWFFQLLVILTVIICFSTIKSHLLFYYLWFILGILWDCINMLLFTNLLSTPYSIHWWSFLNQFFFFNEGMITMWFNVFYYTILYHRTWRMSFSLSPIYLQTYTLMES